MLRRLVTKNPSTTTVTVTRVSGSHVDENTGEEVPDTVIVTTEAPAAPPDPHRLTKVALTLSITAITFAVITLTWRIIREEMRR